MRPVYFVIGNNRFFGQGRKPWDPIDMSIVERILNEHSIKCILKSYHEIINGEPIDKSIPVIYSFSQREEVREYIKDMVAYLTSEGYNVIPSSELLYCHENKGFQELVKKKYDIRDLKAYYFCEIEEIEHYNLKYPLVLKRLDGSNGKGVFLIEDEKTLVKQVNSFTSSYTGNQRIDLLRRKYLRGNKAYKEYPNYSNSKDYIHYRKHIQSHKRFVIQEFIEGLDHDYRVLKAGERFYITKRHTKKGCFKASGTKMFDFEIENPLPILEYAKNISDKIKAPFLSMDICIKNKEFYLLEFQGLHFGMNVVVKSKGYYKYNDNTFNFIKCKSTPEEAIGYGVAYYLENN